MVTCLRASRAALDALLLPVRSVPDVRPGEMRALYCGPHKQEGMVNVDQERRTCNRSERPHFPAGS